VETWRSTSWSALTCVEKRKTTRRKEAGKSV